MTMSDGDEVTKPVSLATIGRFRLIRRLGRGGMGEVFLADDPLLNRSVALKLLTPEVAKDPERRIFFQREAASAAALNHPNICTIFEIGEADGRPFIAMEAIEGRTLSAMCKDGKLPVETVMSIALQVASALEEARERHVVHRDLKAANIMVTPKGAAKVLDFGLAKRVTPGPSPPTQTTAWVSRSEIVFGTLPYMSPEQALGRNVDHRSDLFSFGTILYEALTARLPFDGPTTPEVLNAIVNKEPTPIAERNPRVPPALEMVIAKLHAKDPADRYQTAADVLADLHAIQQTGDLARRRANISRRRLTVAAVVAATALAVSGAVWWWRSHQITVTTTRTVQSLVVVPASVTGPPQFQFLADAIPSSLTTQLAAHGGITMKVPPTFAEFSTVGGNLIRVADSYSVSTCIVPRATVAAGRLTVNVQIVEPRRRDVLWSGEFESPIERYGDAVAHAADAVALALTGRRPAIASAGSKTSAHELAISRGLYYGRTYNNKYERSDYDLAAAAYREALEIEPRSAAAAAGLAYLEIFAMQGGRPPATALPQLDLWAQRAIEFDPKYGLGWAALAVAESWRPKPDRFKQLDYGFRAASVGETCGSCQLALLEGMMPFSAVLTHHIALHDAELDPISAYGHINSAVALTALGRTDEASAAIARAAAIEPDARWVAVLRTLTEAASGALKAASSDADALLGRESLKTMPVWVPSMLELIKAEAGGDERARARALATLREPARQGRATLFELSYLSAIAAPFLAREGRSEDALALLGDVTAQGAPPPYDIVVMNPSLRRVMDDPRARSIVASSSTQFALLLKAIDAARAAGRFPLYLERPLQDLRSTLGGPGRAD